MLKAYVAKVRGFGDLQLFVAAPTSSRAKNLCFKALKSAEWDSIPWTYISINRIPEFDDIANETKEERSIGEISLNEYRKSNCLKGYGSTEAYIWTGEIQKLEHLWKGY